MSDFDSPWKLALDVFFEPFLDLFFAEAHGDIDWSRDAVPLDKELQQVVREAEVGRRFVDKLVKVWLKSGQEQWVLIHVEVQASVDASFGLRMYVYNYRLFDRYNREVASFAVLGDDDPRWRPDSFSYRRWGVEAGLWFPIVKLLDYVDRRRELEESVNPFATVIMAHLDTLETRGDDGGRKDRKFRLTKRLLERGWETEQVRQLFAVIDWMMDLPEPLAIEFLEQVKQHTGGKNMPYISTAERVGLARGLSEGRIEGIETALELKFGQLGLQVLPEIRQIKDKDKLEAILRSIKTAASLDDLRRIWAG